MNFKIIPDDVEMSLKTSSNEKIYKYNESVKNYLKENKKKDYDYFTTQNFKNFFNDVNISFNEKGNRNYNIDNDINERNEEKCEKYSNIANNTIGKIQSSIKKPGRVINSPLQNRKKIKNTLRNNGSIVTDYFPTINSRISFDSKINIRDSKKDGITSLFTLNTTKNIHNDEFEKSVSTSNRGSNIFLNNSSLDVLNYSINNTEIIDVNYNESPSQKSNIKNESNNKPKRGVKSKKSFIKVVINSPNKEFKNDNKHNRHTHHTDFKTTKADKLVHPILIENYDYNEVDNLEKLDKLENQVNHVNQVNQVNQANQANQINQVNQNKFYSPAIKTPTDNDSMSIFNSKKRLTKIKTLKPDKTDNTNNKRSVLLNQNSTNRVITNSRKDHQRKTIEDLYEKVIRNTEENLKYDLDKYVKDFELENYLSTEPS